MSAFRPYDGWEKDVREIAEYAESFHDLKTPQCAPARRLLAALGPEKCGAMLRDADGFCAERKTGGQGDGSAWGPITCGLLAGHHPFAGGSSGDPDAHCCGKPAGDPIHSPGHVPNVPEGAWR